MKVVFPDFEQSDRCHWSCEYAFVGSVCLCTTCNGLNHGRSAYLQRERQAAHYSHSTYKDGEVLEWFKNGRLVWCHCAEQEITVSSSTFSATVRARGFQQAFEMFMAASNPDSLSDLTEFRIKGKAEGEEMWGLTVWYLEAMGLMKKSEGVAA